MLVLKILMLVYFAVAIALSFTFNKWTYKWTYDETTNESTGVPVRNKLYANILQSLFWLPSLIIGVVWGIENKITFDGKSYAKNKDDKE